MQALTVHSNPAVCRLWRICKAWRGELKFVNHERYEELFASELSTPSGMDSQRALGYLDSPSARWHGLVWERKHIYVVPEHANPGTIIHEMGHVFADYGANPEDSDEWEWLGWEICMARWARCFKVWSEQNSTYGLGDEYDSEDWGYISAKVRKSVIADRIAHGKAKGIIDKNNRPLSVR